MSRTWYPIIGYDKCIEDPWKSVIAKGKYYHGPEVRESLGQIATSETLNRERSTSRLMQYAGTKLKEHFENAFAK